MSKNIKLKRTIKILGFLLLGFLLLWYVTKDQDNKRIIHELRNANYWWILLSMIVGVISHFFRALRWNLLITTLGYKTKTSATFYALMTGYLFNLVVPRLGEITRCGVLHRSSKISFSILFGTVLSERFFDMICLLLLIGITIILQFFFLKNFLGEYLYYPLLDRCENNLLLSIAGVLIIVSLITFIYIYLKKHFYKAKPESRMSWIKMHIKGMGSGIKALKYMKKKWWFLFYSLMIWFNYFLMVYFCFFAIEELSHFGFSEGITVLSLGSLGIVAPVPGGIGTYHFIVIKILTELYNILPEFAASYAYISHASQVLMLLLTGIFSVVMVSFVVKKISFSKINANKNEHLKEK